VCGSASESIERREGTIREAAPADAPALAALSGQLGYPVAAAEMEERLRALLGDPRHAVFVWQGADGQVLGWIHVFRSLYLEIPPMAEIGGLVIDEGARGRGIGAALVERVERWALEQGLARMRVRSRLERADAHRFYDRLGYARFKRSQVFTKELVS
jgi:GNAT superfamily N-acetyltransferase